MPNKDIYNYGPKKNFVMKLQELCIAWQRRWSAPLEHRQDLLNLWASGFYDKTYTREHLINLIHRGVSTVVPFLVEGNPKVLVDSLIPKFRPTAYSTQLALNFILDKINISENVFIPAATNSMFGAAITRVIYNYDRKISLKDKVIKVGSPWVSIIDDSNYIGDPSAKRRSDFAFEGDVYRLPTEFAKDLFAGKDKRGKQIADYITSDFKLRSDFSPDDISNPGFDFNRLSLRDYTTFIDIYLYDENVILTILPEGGRAKILREVEWDGPDGGPYDYLGYVFFPDCPIPIPPAWALYDLDESINIVAKTAREQAESQKDVFVAPAGDEEIADRLVKAKNLDVLSSMSPELVKKFSVGGINEINHLWMQFAEQQFTKSGFTPDVLGGRGAQAPTLGQEQMVYQNATRIVNNMYTRFQNFMTSIIRKLAWGIWTDPTQYIPMLETIPGVGEVPIVFAGIREASDFYNFVFNIVPYSSQRMSPETKYSRLMQFMGQWILPTMQLSQAQGAQLDIPLATKILADYAGLSESVQNFYKTAIPSPPNDKMPYYVMPSQKGQSNDIFGALDFSRDSNKQQQQEREGITTKPTQEAK